MSEGVRLRIDEALEGEPPSGAIDLSDLVGTWVNTDQHVTGRVLRMELREESGTLRVRAFGPGDTEPHDWGEVEAKALARWPGETRAWGFWCRYDLDTIATEIAAYYNSGIVVIGSYSSFGPASGRADHWKREFFYKLSPGEEVPVGTSGATDFAYAHDRFEGGRPVRPSVDLAPLAGTWVGFTDDLTGLTELEVAGGRENATVRVTGSGEPGPPDWGAVPARVFTDDVGRREAFAFRARYEHGFEDVELFCYLNRRVLIAELATAFQDDSGRSPYFTRIFYRCR